MNPLETLAAARLSPVGPYVPAREEWLEGWTGPVEVYIGPDTRWVRAALLDGFPVFMAHEGLPQRLDLRRPEVRDLLVRCGCPSWARDCAPAVWAWAGGGAINGVFGPWQDDDRYEGVRRLLLGVAKCEVACSALTPDMWLLAHVYENDAHAVATERAVRTGHLCAEPRGWYVPLVGGGVGWWPKNLEATP